MDRAVRAAAEVLAGGGLVILPTETVYGFGTALVPEAVARLMAAKRRGRPDAPERPLLVLVGARDAEPARALAWTPAAIELADVFWPGALTLVLADPGARFPAGVRSAEGTVAVRATPHPAARALVEAAGGALTSTSANEPGRPPAATFAEALEAARALGLDDVLGVDGGTLPPSAPSTLVDCTGETPRVLREGAVPVSRLRCVLPEVAP
ncbi:MAG: Sua5/YciO/YrdC/YwlC family protein [Gemmatimonadetes bacterium]|nr:MAG: Sua5/YciO/YrdC/YwlC family protein [Gemmatimonadota bacterium]